MTNEHILLQIAKLIYNQDGVKARLAHDLDYSRTTIDKMLNQTELTPQQRRELIGFIRENLDDMQQREAQLMNIEHELRGYI